MTSNWVKKVWVFYFANEQKAPIYCIFQSVKLHNFPPLLPKDLQGQSQNWTPERKFRLRWNCSHPPMSFIRDVLQTEIRNFDGNGPRPGERCETKWCMFAKIHPNVRLEDPGTEQNFRFGSGWPVRVCPCGNVLWQFGIAGRRINFCSFCLFFSYCKGRNFRRRKISYFSVQNLSYGT